MEPDSNPNRRRVLQGVVVAGAGALAISLPSRWTRPIVESIIVPAHAAASKSTTTTTTTLDPSTTDATETEAPPTLEPA